MTNFNRHTINTIAHVKIIPSNSTDTGQGAWLPFTGPAYNSSHSLVASDRRRSEQTNSCWSLAWRESGEHVLCLKELQEFNKCPEFMQHPTSQLMPTTWSTVVPFLACEELAELTSLFSLAYTQKRHWQCTGDGSLPSQSAADSTCSIDPDNSFTPLPFSMQTFAVMFSWIAWHSVTEVQTKNSSCKLNVRIWKTKSNSRTHLTSLKSEITMLTNILLEWLTFIITTVFAVTIKFTTFYAL